MALQTRLDVSNVPLQGAYLAKQCPVRAQYDVLGPAEPLSPSDALLRRFDLGNEFEAEIYAALVEAHPDATSVSDRDAAEREAATSRAMDEQADLIIGGRLPGDASGRRAGEPDVLVRAGDGYQPVDVKWHKTLAPLPETGVTIDAIVSDLADPAFDAARPEPELVARKRKADLLQLAHYRRMLEACGRAARNNRGAIIGTEEQVVWYDLDEPVWRTPSRTETFKYRSTMEVYDFEFGFRLDIIANTQRHIGDPELALLVVPVWIGDCYECPWHDYCLEQMQATDDVSLVPKTGWNGWKRHRDHGVSTRADLAALDRITAELVAGNVDVANALAEGQRHEPDTPIAEVVGRRKWAQIDKLEALGIKTAADCVGLDPKTASYGDVGATNLPRQIDLARAALAPEPVFRRRDVTAIEVPRADVEVDIDLENTEAGVYLWGVLTTDRADTGIVSDGYRPFVTWEPLSTEVETALFAELWNWLADLRNQVHKAGCSLRIYCYNERVEADAMRRLADPDQADAVEELVESEDWIDLYRVSRDNLVSPGGYGLKRLAPIAGFEWADDDPGGAASMTWHDIAVDNADPAVSAGHRERLLGYNRDDVAATKALREWLDGERSSIPAITDLDTLYES